MSNIEVIPTSRVGTERFSASATQKVVEFPVITGSEEVANVRLERNLTYDEKWRDLLRWPIQKQEADEFFATASSIVHIVGRQMKFSTSAAKSTTQTVFLDGEKTSLSWSQSTIDGYVELPTGGLIADDITETEVSDLEQLFEATGTAPIKQHCKDLATFVLQAFQSPVREIA